jgi:ribosomal protein S6--L-glutamate ligase
MNIVILSRKRTLYSTRRLIETAEVFGHTVQVMDPLRCNLVIDRHKPSMFYGKDEVANIDVVLPRIGTTITDYGLAVVNHFDMMGIPVVNNSTPIARARDKLRCLQLLSRHDIDIPRTVMLRNPQHMAGVLEMVGGVPLILMLLKGTQGIGVMIAETREAVESVLETMWGLGQNILLQEFVQESKGRDVRALVVGGRVVAAMRRTARMGEFRSNLHRGGSGTVVELDETYQRVALDAARVLGLEIAGVDLLESNRGPKVMEINASPGFEGLERATGLDIARMMIDHAVNFCRKDRARRRAESEAELDLEDAFRSKP